MSTRLTIRSGDSAENAKSYKLFLKNLVQRLPHTSQLSSIVVTGQKLPIAVGTLIGHGIESKEVDQQSGDDERAESEGLEEGEGSDTEAKGPEYDYVSTLTGHLTFVDSLAFVDSFHSKYTPEVGDVVVGRVIEISQGRWILDIGAAQPGILQLVAVALPSGEQRRKTDAERIDMQRFFQEDDILCTEVQKVGQDGQCLLHTRNTRYGKLANGCSLVVSPQLVPRLPQHSNTFACGAHVILSNNGYIWIGTPPILQATDTLNYTHGSSTTYEPVTLSSRKAIARIRQCILFLAKKSCVLHLQAIQAVYDATINLSIPTSQILDDMHTLTILSAILGR